MNILSIGNFRRGWDGSICDEEHIAKALEGLGHQVERCQRESIQFTNGGQWDFTLISQWDGYGELSSNLPRPLVYWAFDHQADGQEWHERLIKESDIYLSKRIADSKYSNWQWLSQDFAPQFLDKYPERIEKDIDVLFTGSYLPWAHERNEILKAVDEKFNLVIHSVTPDVFRERGFKHVFGPVMDYDLPKLIARARVNISVDHTIEAGYWSDRNAQIMACGGLVLFKYVPLSKSIFKDHIVYFKGVEDCLWRLQQILERPQEDLDSVAEGGYAYVHEYMMVEDRVKDLLTIVDDYL